MAYHFPILGHGDRDLRSDDPKFKFLLVGTCQLMPISGALGELGHQADHVLWNNHAFSEIPDILAEDSYDANVFNMTLRHVLYRAILDLYPEIPEQMIEIEPLWVRAFSEGKAEEFFDCCKRVVRSLVGQTERLVGSRPSFYMTFLQPRRNFMGNMFKRYSLENISYFVEELNKYIERIISRFGNCHLVDINELFSEYGRLYLQDDYTMQVAHASFIHDFGIDEDTVPDRMTPLTPMCQMYSRDEHFSRMTHATAQRISENVQILKQPLAIKLIICDLDDTLWRGVSGEKEHMTWNEVDGWPLGLAEALLVYKARGGMLAICSKNEQEPTLVKFRQAFRDGLRIEDFASVKINYESKAENIRRILSEVNILPQNALFIDDNPREVDEVRKVFPDMQVLNTEPYDWRRKILFSPLTQVAVVSGEAKLRTQSIQAKIQRDEARNGASREQWLTSLAIEQHYAVVDGPAHENYARAFELVNKTNQFNTTGQRWNDDEMRTFLASGGRIFCTFLKDKMVDNGLISAFLYKDDAIVQGVLSCRVFGLGSEYATMHHLAEHILERHSRVTGQIVDTGRNFTCHPFFTNAGFIAVDDRPGTFAATVSPALPAHVASHYNVRVAV